MAFLGPLENEGQVGGLPSAEQKMVRHRVKEGECGHSKGLSLPSLKAMGEQLPK